MDAEEYEQKVRGLLEDPVYRKVKKDPTPATERKVLKEVRDLEKKDLIPKVLATRLKPTASRAPKLYGLPKIHKPDIHLRPIVSSIGSPTYHLAKYVNTLIAPLAGQTSSFVLDSRHFVDFVRDVKIQSNEVMVSFDKSLFTNVPVDEALEVIHQRLSEDETLENRTALTPGQITHLLELCLKTTYFCFREEYYQQKDGAAMGSPVVANIYMEMFEEMALSTTQQKPKIWKRYVDDTFCVMEEERVSSLLEHLNKLQPTIKFTMEVEDNKSLSFLDTLLKRREDGGLDISVYRKPTHTDRYLQYSSHHPTHVLRGVATCLFNIKREEEHLMKVLKNIGYPEHIIQAAATWRGRRKQQEEDPMYTICLPYVAGVSEDLRRVCRKYSFRTVFTTITTLRRQLTKIKDVEPFLRRAGVIYKIPCSCGQAYIGETKRTLETRLKEHQAATRRGETEKSAIAEHAWEKQHHPSWKETSILDQAKNMQTLLIKEAIYITLTGQEKLLNRDQGTAISDCWRPLTLLRCALQVHWPRRLT